jgi:Fe-S-cluster-containing dehydrogenase component
MKVMVIDITKCNGCFNCQIACKDEHVGNDWSPYAKPQPDTGHFWMKVTDMVRGTVPKVKITYLLDVCQHCDDAPCISACNQKAIYKRDDGVVIIDPEKCAGRMDCIHACPYKVIYFNDVLNIAQKCSFCTHLLDQGWKEPRCVEVCPTGALKFGEEEELKDIIAGAEILHPEFNTKPRVYYIGLPKLFVTGDVYDAKKEECIPGAKATLTDLATGEEFAAETDGFGCFWLEGLKAGTFSLEIRAEGYPVKTISNIDVEKDVNLGDISLS